MSPPSSTTTALIAEDEPLLRKALQRELAQAWPELHVVAATGNGMEAVEVALRLRPQVLFLDIRMPGLSGLEVAAELSDRWPGDQPFPQLVFVTAYDEYATQAFEAEALDYLLKPVQPERLARTVARLQARLSSEAFWQIHRGTVVQATHIQQVTRDEAGRLHVHLRDRPDTWPVSRLYAYRFKAM